MLNITVLLALLAIGLVRLLIRRSKLQQIAKHFPGPIPVFPLGNVLKFPKDIGGIFRRMLRFHDEYGPDIVTWGIGNDMKLNLSSTKNVEKVLNAKSIQKSTAYGFFEPWLGKGLVTASGKKWFHRRKIITPTFHFKILEGFAEVFNRGLDVLVEKLKVHDGGDEFDIYDYISLYTLDSICETAMGVQVNAQNDLENQYVRDVNRLAELIVLRIFSLLRIFPNLYWYLHPNAWEQRRLVRRLHRFTDSVILNRRQKLVNRYEKGSLEEDTGAKKKQTFLDLLLSMTVEGEPLSNEDIREEVDTFMFAGHDTTSSAISFTILQLAKHQDIQEKLYQEIEFILKQQNSETNPAFTYNNIQDFKYLDLVVKESLRILPPISYVGRKLTEDTEINGAIIPAGQDISIPIYMVHRNPKVYPDPERFNPERFADDSENTRGPYDYIPFSIGSRNCIGQKYGLMQLKMTVARLIANFRVLPGESTWDVKLRTDLVLRPERGIPIRIKSRN